jgi:TolA-binding protein
MNASSTEEKVTTLVSVVDDLQDTVETLETTVEEQSETIVEQSEEIDELQDRIDELQADSARERAETKQRLTTVEDTLESAGVDADPGVGTEQTTIQPADLTPVEQLSRAEDVSDVTDSPSVERAVAVFRRLEQWGKKTPTGIVLRPEDNPVSLLEAERDESLSWKQWYRACEALEKLSEGAVTFFESDRHGKMICLHEQSEAYDRVAGGALTVSSAGERA